MNNIQIGAEVFIEPGQTAEEIELWFQRLQECGMTVTRIRMFENYMHKADDSWDYKLFDIAFHAAERFGIAIYANLFPATDFTDVGGFKFPESDENLKDIANYIENVVLHFKEFPALLGWVPINEPGSGILPSDEFSIKMLEDWKLQLVKSEYNSQGFTTLDFSRERFLLNHNTWFLKWLTDQIHIYHPGSLIHVNNHAIFQNVAEYDFPEWRKFLTTLGGSAHVSWHFEYFTRQKYALGMSANSEILRSGAGPIPWLMTELQGGNNTYSAFEPMCPTPEEIAQWLWITIGSGSKGSIFWCLNPRRSGFEAGEWAMLNFQDQPSDRMDAAKSVISVIEEYGSLFGQAEVVDSRISILYTRESLWIEKTLQVEQPHRPSNPGFEGRKPGAGMKSALAYFEALSEMGINPNFKEIGEFDFNQEDYTNSSIILAHQISIPSKYWKPVIRFVELGGTLIADGLTAYYDERAYTLMGKNFPFASLFGASVREFKVVKDIFDVSLTNPNLNLIAHLWKGTLTGKDQTVARNNYGRGTTLYIPSLIGLGARIANDFTSLSKLLKLELKKSIQALEIVFKDVHSNVLMKVLKNDCFLLTLLVNKSEYAQSVAIIGDSLHDPRILFANKKGYITPEFNVVIHSEETIVLRWEKKNGAVSSETAPF